LVQIQQILWILSNHPASGNKVANASFPYCQIRPDTMQRFCLQISAFQKRLKLRQYRRRRAFLHVMTTGHAFARDIDTALFPNREHVVKIVHGPGFRPEHEERASDLL